MRKNKCALCGGKINSDGICTECGYNNRPTLKNRKSSASGFSFGYVILIASAVIFTALAIAIVHTSINMEKDYKHSFVLGPGMHHVGTDIPAGKYHIQTEKNESSIMGIYRFEEDIFYGVSGYHFDREHRYEKNSHFLNNGSYIVIEPGDELGFYTNNNLDPLPDKVETGYTGEYVLDRYSYAGSDFPVGVYDIVYTPQLALGDVTVSIYSLHPSTGEFLMEWTLPFNESEGEQVFTGVPFTQRTKISLSRDGAQITLKPTEFTSRQLYELTWGYRGE
ncbi:MAG: hypothetical protein IJ410_05135 [Oscillospiraceae bacterium]|nr:hypothetical protein [Oscillospiraceae bacterium]